MNYTEKEIKHIKKLAYNRGRMHAMTITLLIYLLTVIIFLFVV